MKDVTNRKLFRKSAARDRLRQMGGIMSSSPELMDTVQNFRVGGDVQARVQQQRQQDRRFLGNLAYPFAAAADLVNIPAAALQNLVQDVQYGPIGRLTGMSEYGEEAPADVTGTPAMQRVTDYMNTQEGDLFNVDVPSVVPSARAETPAAESDVRYPMPGTVPGVRPRSATNPDGRPLTAAEAETVGTTDGGSWDS
jgi:hypothetical protein